MFIASVNLPFEITLRDSEQNAYKIGPGKYFTTDPSIANQIISRSPANVRIIVSEHEANYAKEGAKELIFGSKGMIVVKGLATEKTPQESPKNEEKQETPVEPTANPSPAIQPQQPPTQTQPQPSPQSQTSPPQSPQA